MPTRWSDSVEIRPLAVDDVEAVAALERKELSPWGRTLIASELTRGDSVLFGAVEGGTLIAWCCARFLDYESELLKICVARESRRLGIAWELVSRLAEKLKEHGVEEMYLEVRSNNAAALAFYRQAGFAEIGRRPDYYTRPDDHAVIMKKEL